MSNTPTPSHRISQSLGLTGCRNCLVYNACGGHPLEIIFAIGCANHFKPDPQGDADDMHPQLEERFWELWDDVYGLDDFTISKLLPITHSLPKYVPLLQHRYMKRARLLDAPFVALKLFDVIGKRSNGTYASKYANAAELRKAYGLRETTGILLVGVDHDGPIEAFWAHHQVSGVCEAIANLGVIGVTIPNFSFFTCVPRFQILRNRKRILLTAERLSQAGVKVSPHLNANTPADWDFWVEFLHEHPEITTVTMEFQTGPRAKEEYAREAFEGLVSVQQRLGSPLHPVLVGAARVYQQVQKEFKSFTVIDSQPFMQAMHRQVLVKKPDGKYRWCKSMKPEGGYLDDLMETNILRYPDKLATTFEEVELLKKVFNQLEFPWETSIPDLTAQPVAPEISEMNPEAVF